MLAATRQFSIPKRGDIPVVLAISLFHMVAFAALMTAGLKYVPVGRSIVLGYTTPLWVAPGAWLLLKEDLSARQMVGIAIGLTGLAVMFNPSAFDWGDHDAVLGNGLLLLSALAWSVSILYTRAHHWLATPFQLVFWQALLATILLTILAMVIEGELSYPLEQFACHVVRLQRVGGNGPGFLGHDGRRPQRPRDHDRLSASWRRPSSASPVRQLSSANRSIGCFSLPLR